MSILNPLLSVLLLQPASATITGEALVGPAPAPAPALVPAPAPLGTPPERGLGFFIPGAIVTGIAIPILASGAIRLNAAHQCNWMERDCLGTIGGGLIMYFGAVVLATGLPLLAIGAHRLRLYNRWRRQNGLLLRPQFGRNRNAWSVGLELRF